MTSRRMIVGGDHIVGAEHSDYGTLMHVGAEHSHHHGHHGHQGYGGSPPYGYAPQPGYGPPPPPQYPHGYPPPHAQQAPPPYHAPPHHPHEAQGRHVEHEEPKKKRDFPLGFLAKAIPYNGFEDIEVKPQVLFKGKRLAVSPMCSRYFTITDIKVGKDSQLAATGSMAAECFSALAVGVEMELDTAQPGIVITIRVENTGDASMQGKDSGPRDFAAVLYGAVLT